ncbi:conserved hypothetical protein [Agrobacterium tomkonis CFBP 6623]|uniref:Transmembrane protein n=2 Tax=Agrobacterium tumefaciens complex TaxID=1183400 RepID=A0A1S7PL43_9HYPH|nr:conserved hypothetical protein [Agrobacterium tomkonis CFBP 6623]
MQLHFALQNMFLREMAPRAGFEPATCRLTVECSTAELPGNVRCLARCERGNTNAFPICQAVFSKKTHSSCFIPLKSRFSGLIDGQKIIHRPDAEGQDGMKFGMNHKTGRLHVGKWSLAMPRSRVGRIATGSALVVGGTLGFLPVLGFWMIPLGLVVLSHDLPAVRRRRRRLAVWWASRQNRREARDRDR